MKLTYQIGRKYHLIFSMKLHKSLKQEKISEIIISTNEKVKIKEGYLYKLTKHQKIKRMWFRLFNRNLFCKFALMIFRLQI